VPEAVNLQSQRGQTLVELLVGIAITGIVLAAVAGLLYTVSDRFAGWGARLDTATDGFSLAGALQADGHRYRPCGSGTSLTFCRTVGDCSPTVPAVIYWSTQVGGTDYLIKRTEGDKVTLVGRAQAAPNPPWFTYNPNANAIHVQGISSTLTDLVVFYHPPAPC
jgi:prepilin-type N-terminal cleavage/methylation domain-containing protein